MLAPTMYDFCLQGVNLYVKELTSSHEIKRQEVNPGDVRSDHQRGGSMAIVGMGGGGYM